MKFYKLILLSSIFLLTLPAYADIERGTMSSIATEDGTTRVYPYEIKVPNTALSDNSDGTASISTSVGDAPSTADYLVGTTQSGLSAEIVVGTTPGGSLGGTWGSPTVDDDSHAHTGSTLSSIDISADTNLTGTANQIILTDDTLSTPQDIHTTATPQFARLGLGIAADATSLLTLAVAGKIEFKGGASATGTLAWGPTGTRAIILPDQDGTIALIDGTNNWSTLQLFSAVPTGTGFGSGSLYANPASATAGYTLFGVGVGDVEKFKVDAEGDVTLNSIIIGANTLATSEWVNLDGIDQTLATTSTPQFARLGLGVAADASDLLALSSNGVITSTGAISIDLVNASDVTLSLKNSGAGLADFVLDGSLTLSTNGEILTIPYDASRNITYGSGEGMLLPSGLDNIIAMTLTNPATGSSIAYAFNISTSANTGVAFDFVNSRIAFMRGGSAQASFYVSAGGGLTIDVGRFIIANAVTPASATAAGTTGTIAWDTSYIYVCTATNTWERVAIASW